MDLITHAIRAGERMVHLLEDLLDVTAIDTGHLILTLEQRDLSAWLRAVVQEQQLLAQTKSLTLRSASLDAMGATPPQTNTCIPAVFDPNRLEQVIVNLISNAIKFSQPHTTITVSARTQDGPEGQPGVEICVTDQGPGITPADQERLFDAFATTRNQPTGGEPSTGLGLAISKRIVAAHGGQLGVTSVSGQGATFTVWLPASAP